MDNETSSNEETKMDYRIEAESLCARQNLRFLSCEIADENTCYARGITRDQFGEVWALEFKDGELTLATRVIRFSLFGDPEIPMCLLDDAKKLHEYMKTEGRLFRETQVDGTGEVA